MIIISYSLCSFPVS